MLTTLFDYRRRPAHLRHPVFAIPRLWVIYRCGDLYSSWPRVGARRGRLYRESLSLGPIIFRKPNLTEAAYEPVVRVFTRRGPLVSGEDPALVL
jgi:hypothetical protein